MHEMCSGWKSCNLLDVDRSSGSLSTNLYQDPHPRADAPSVGDRFNAIAVTYLKKALNKILDSVYTSRSSDSAFHPSRKPAPKVLEQIIAHSSGDIRSALMSLQFLSSFSVEVRSTGAILGVAEKSKGKKRKLDDRDDGAGASGEAGVKKL